MSGVRFAALSSRVTRPSAFRATNWLRTHYVSIAAVILVLLFLNEVNLYGTRVSAWDWLLVSGWITFLLAFKVTFSLPGMVDDVLNRLAASHVLGGGNSELGDFKQQIKDQAQRAARFGGILVAAVIALGWTVATRGALASRLPTVLTEVAGAYLPGTFIGRAISYSRLGQRLKGNGFSINVDPENLDGVAGLRPVGRLYFFQSTLVAVPGAFLAVWWFVIPFYGARYRDWRGVYAGLLVFVVACEVLAFVWPMWSFHRVMKDAKANFLAEADRISEQVSEMQKQLRDSDDEESTARLENRLERMTARYRAIVEMQTWPVDKSVQRRFAVNNLILFVPVVAQVLGAPGSWQDFLANLQKAFSGHG
jgi:hypothetical protein